LRRLIRDLESENIELKPSLSQMREIVESAAAFAGAKGGKIIVGVDDKGNVLGVQIGKDTIETLANKIRDNTDPVIYPGISVVEEKNKNVIVIGVKESHRKPVLAFNRPFKRVGKSTVRMNRDEYERTILEGHRDKLRFDSEICKEATLEDIDEEKVRWFLRKAKKERGFDVDPEICAEEALMRLKLLKGDKLTNSAVLLFGKQPQNLFLQDRIRCARFKGVTPIDFIDMKIIEGNLFDLLDATEKFILSHIRKAAKIVMFKREEAWEYPPDAIREAIVNALIHRDYWVSGNIRVGIYDDRVEITNPGELLEPLTPEMLKKEHESILRNPLLANAFS